MEEKDAGELEEGLYLLPVSLRVLAAVEEQA
jgi:hypothetical protein